jgi:hypothetical protein
LTISGVFDNGGILSANGVGALTLDGALVNGGGGIVQTVGSGVIILEDDAVITNQTDLTIAAGGTLTTTDGDTGDVVEATVFNQGTINVTDDSTLIVDGHWQNSSVINLDGTGDPTLIQIQGGNTWELLGDGTVTLNGVGTGIVSGGPNAQLDNKTETIAGSGSIGDANMTVNNNAGATIEATGGTLTIDATAYNSGTNSDYIYNAGVMEAASTGALTIEAAMSNFGRLIASSGGFIDALGQVFGNGLAEIEGASAIAFAQEVDNDVVFSGKAAGALILNNSTPSEANDPFYGSISGFAAGDRIDLADLAFNKGTMSVAPASGFGTLDASLVVSNGVTTSTSLYLLGGYTSGEFRFKNDGSGGTDITLVKPA